MSATKEQGEQNKRKGSRREQSESERPSASVNMDELRELIALMKENGLAELELEREEFRVRLRRDFGPAESHHSAPVTTCSCPCCAPPRQRIPVHKPQLRLLRIRIYTSSHHQSWERSIARRLQLLTRL